MYKVALLYHANEAKSHLISVAITTLHTHSLTDDDIHPPFAKKNQNPKQNKKAERKKEKTKKMCHYYHYYCPSCDVLINTAMVRCRQRPADRTPPRPPPHGGTRDNTSHVNAAARCMDCEDSGYLLFRKR